MKVTDINEDFKDGIKLLVLLELLTGEKLVSILVCGWWCCAELCIWLCCFESHFSEIK